jgi:hypothetical protein
MIAARLVLVYPGVLQDLIGFSLFGLTTVLQYCVEEIAEQKA